MSRTARPLVRMLSVAADGANSPPSTPSAPRPLRPMVVGGSEATGASTDFNLPLADVAGTVVAAVRKVVPSCASAVVVRVGGRWQLLAQSGPADVSIYHQRHLESTDLAARGVVRTERHLVAEIASRDVAAGLLLVALSGREVPEHAHEIVRPILEDAASNLDVAAALQRHDRALRRVELLGRPGGGQADSVSELERAVACLWPRCVVRYVAVDALAGLDHATRRLVRSASETETATEPPEPTGSMLLGSDWVHRVAVPVSARGALLIEPAAGGEALDRESVAAAGAAARIWSLVGRLDALQAELVALRDEDPETGCLVGASLEQHLGIALKAQVGSARTALIVFEVDPHDAEADTALAARVGRRLAITAGEDRAEIFRLGHWRYAVLARTGAPGDVRRLARHLTLAVRDAGDSSCSASAGIAFAPTHGSTPRDLLEAARYAIEVVAADDCDR